MKCIKCRKDKGQAEFRLKKNNTFTSRCSQCLEKDKKRRNSDSFLRKECAKLQSHTQDNEKSNHNGIRVCYKFIGDCGDDKKRKS